MQTYQEKELVDYSDISGFIKNSDLDNKVKTLATNTGSKSEQDKIVKLETHDLS